MSITGLTPLVNTNTFGQWKDRTNEIIESLEDVVTIGDAETNAGNVVITGNITSSNTVISDRISPFDGALDTITLTSLVAIEGNLTLDNTLGGIAKISLKNAGTTTWEIEADSTHDNLNIGKGNVALTIDELSQTLTGTNITIDAAILPGTISGDVIGDVYASNGTTIVLDSGNGTTPATFTGNVSGNATTASTLATARDIILSGDVSGTVAFNGSQNVTITTVVADDSHNHVISNIDNLQSALDAKASTTALNSLQTIVNGKANLAGSTSQSFSASTLSATTVSLASGWTVSVDANGRLTFSVNGNVRMRLDTTGNLIVEGDVTAYGAL